jgi:hypothetical protein
MGYTRSLGDNNNVEHARSMALATIGSALVLVQVPALASLLHLSPLHADDWLIAGLGGLLGGSLAAFLSSLAGERATSQRKVRGKVADRP